MNGSGSNEAFNNIVVSCKTIMIAKANIEKADIENPDTEKTDSKNAESSSSSK